MIVVALITSATADITFPEPCLSDKQGKHEQDDDNGDTHDSRHTGLALVGFFRLHVGELGNDPEVGVVRMRSNHGTSADGKNDDDARERGGESHGLEQRSHHACRRDHSNRGCAHGEFEDHRDDEGNEYAEAGVDKATDRGSDRHAFQNSAEGASRTGDCKNACGIRNALRDPCERVFLLSFRNQGDSEEYTDQKSDDRVTKEHDNLINDTLTERFGREVRYGSKTDQDNREKDGSEALQSSRELSVLLLELFQRVFRVCRNVDLAGNFLGVEDCDQCCGNGNASIARRYRLCRKYSDYMCEG